MRVVCFECPDCGHQAHVVWKDTELNCRDCAAPMERFGTVGVVESVGGKSRQELADSDGWSPEDGAGYIPTEERNNGD